MASLNMYMYARYTHIPPVVKEVYMDITTQGTYTCRAEGYIYVNL